MTHYVCSLWSMLGTVFVLCLWVLKRNFLSVVMLFYSKTELMHNTAEMVGMRMGLIGTKRGFILVFTLCNKHNCVIKNTGFFFQHLRFDLYYRWFT